ncbi:16159_t:CDS:2, partial [Acaulospora morrowiae]
ETYEEIGILPTDVDILGQDVTLPNKDLTMHVFSFIGFIKYPIDVNEIKYNESEVSSVFTVALKDLLDPEKKIFKQFRDSNIKYPVFKTPALVGLDIWGLTAFILDTLRRYRIGVLRRLTDPSLIKGRKYQ